MMLPLQCHSSAHQTLATGAPAGGVKPDFEVLNVFLGSDEDSRLVLARETNAQGQSQLVLQQESRSPHVGWFTQSRITVDDAQAAALKMTLTSKLIDGAAGQSSRATEQSADESQPANDGSNENSGPQILSFRSSLAG